MSRVINSVTVIDQHPEGPNEYKVGGVCDPFGEQIADIIEAEGNYCFYNEKDELIMEVKGCPVIVRYKEVQESEVK